MEPTQELKSAAISAALDQEQTFVFREVAWQVRLVDEADLREMRHCTYFFTFEVMGEVYIAYIKGVE